MPGLESLRHIRRSGFYDEYSLNAIAKASITLRMRLQFSEMEEVNKAVYFNYPCRRQSCGQVNIPAPCVNKIISHIENVESKLQEHLKQFETSLEEWSRTSSSIDLKEDQSTATPGKKVKPEGERGEKCPELKQEMETLLSETIRLIRSLETDRAEAEYALKQQKLRKKMIIMKIDSWSIWKLQELPLAVQKEHEAYLRDIIELRWHLEDRNHQVEQLQKQKTKLEEANAKVQADIDFMQDHAALLDSKRRQEEEALQEFYQKKIEVMKLSRQTQEELEQITKDCENAKRQIQETKEEMEKDIHDNEINLEMHKKEIDKLKNLRTHCCSKIENVKMDIEESEEAVMEALRETKSSTEEVTALSRTLNDLRKTHDQMCWKQKKHEQQYMEVLNDFYATKKTWDVELYDVTRDFSDISVAYAQAMGENKKLSNEIITITDRISESMKRKAQYESEVQYLLKLKSKNNDYLKQLYQEAYEIGALFHITKMAEIELARLRLPKITTSNSELKKEIRPKRSPRITAGEGPSQSPAGCWANLVEAEGSFWTEDLAEGHEMSDLLRRSSCHDALSQGPTENMSQENTCLFVREDFLKKLTRGKVAAGMIIQKRLYAIQESLLLERQDLVKEKALYVLTLAEILEPLQQLEDDAVRIRAMHTEQAEMEIGSLGKVIGSGWRYVQMLVCVKRKQEAKNKVLITELGVGSALDIFLTIKYKKEQAQAVFDHLMGEKRACEERIREENRTFRKLLAVRQKTLADLKLGTAVEQGRPPVDTRWVNGRMGARSDNSSVPLHDDNS
ncbi:coiled-coil domain-containing protein 178 [Erethizon dorsatum]